VLAAGITYDLRLDLELALAGVLQADQKVAHTAQVEVYTQLHTGPPPVAPAHCGMVDEFTDAVLAPFVAMTVVNDGANRCTSVAATTGLHVGVDNDATTGCNRQGSPIHAAAAAAASAAAPDKNQPDEHGSATVPRSSTEPSSERSDCDEAKGTCRGEATRAGADSDGAKCSAPPAGLPQSQCEPTQDCVSRAAACSSPAPLTVASTTALAAAAERQYQALRDAAAATVLAYDYNSITASLETTPWMSFWQEMLFVVPNMAGWLIREPNLLAALRGEQVQFGAWLLRLCLWLLLLLL
jgi:hypothetical protein